MASSEADNETAMHFTGALTLTHWHEFQSLSKRRRSRLFGYLLLCVSSISSFAAMFIAFRQHDQLLALLAGVALTLTGAYGVWAGVYEIKEHRHRTESAANRQGWFAPTDWAVTESAISYATEMENGSHTGVIPWSAFSKAVIGNTILLLEFSHPYNCAVIAREWVATPAMWERLLELARAHVAQTQRAA